MVPPPKKISHYFFSYNKSHSAMFWPKPNHDSNPSQTMTLTACPVGTTWVGALQQLLGLRPNRGAPPHKRLYWGGGRYPSPSQTMTLTACPVGRTFYLT